MKRWWVAVLLVLACSKSEDKRPPPEPEVSKYELEARAIREAFRVVITDFHADVVAGRIDAAYERLTPMYRASVPLEKFAAAAKHPLFSEGVTFETRGSSISQGTAKVTMWMKGPLGTSQIEMRCTHVDGAWKIGGITVDDMPVLPVP